MQIFSRREACKHTRILAPSNNSVCSRLIHAPRATDSALDDSSSKNRMRAEKQIDSIRKKNSQMARRPGVIQA